MRTPLLLAAAVLAAAITFFLGWWAGWNLLRERGRTYP